MMRWTDAPHWLAGLLAMLLFSLLVAAGDTLAERRKRVAELPAEEKRELLDRKARFEALPAEEQERLRKLYATIERHPDRDRLVAVLNNYYKWLQLLPPTERAELLSLPTEQRLDKIEQRVREEQRQRFLELSDRQLTSSDLDVIHKWLRELIKQREPEMVRRMPFLRGMDPGRRYRTLMFFVVGPPQSRGGEQNPLRPTDEELESLAKQLCPRAQDFLAKLDSPPTRREVMTKWIRTAIQTQLAPPVDSAKLIEILKALPPEERSRLEALGRQQMMDELKRRYLREQWRRGRPGSFPGGGRRPGDRSRRGRPPSSPPKSND